MMTRTDVLGVIVLSSDLQSHHPSSSCLYLLFTSLVTSTHLTNLCVFTFFSFLRRLQKPRRRTQEKVLKRVDCISFSAQQKLI